MSFEHVRAPLTIIYAFDSVRFWREGVVRSRGGGVGYRTFESEDGDLAVRRGTGEDGAELVGSP